MQQAMATGTPYHTRLDPPPASGWTPPESTLEVVTGRVHLWIFNGVRRL
jgi:hypothetical protein